ncbi:hypothetical protein ACK1KB_04630 [Chryseobacterium sp. TY3]
MKNRLEYRSIEIKLKNGHFQFLQKKLMSNSIQWGKTVGSLLQ